MYVRTYVRTNIRKIWQKIWHTWIFRDQTNLAQQNRMHVVPAMALHVMQHNNILLAQRLTQQRQIVAIAGYINYSGNLRARTMCVLSTPAARPR